MASAQDVLPPEIAAQDNSTTVVAVTICMTFIATLFIILRIYGCIFILKRPLYFEEWLSVINQVCVQCKQLYIVAFFVTQQFSLRSHGICIFAAAHLANSHIYRLISG